MLSFRHAMRSARNTATACGDVQPWKRLYYVLVRAERAAKWAKVWCWRRSIGART